MSNDDNSLILFNSVGSMHRSGKVLQEAYFGLTFCLLNMRKLSGSVFDLKVDLTRLSDVESLISLRGELLDLEASGSQGTPLLIIRMGNGLA